MSLRSKREFGPRAHQNAIAKDSHFQRVGTILNRSQEDFHLMVSCDDNQQHRNILKYSSML